MRDIFLLGNLQRLFDYLSGLVRVIGLFQIIIAVQIAVGIHSRILQRSNENHGGVFVFLHHPNPVCKGHPGNVSRIFSIKNNINQKKVHGYFHGGGICLILIYGPVDRYLRVHLVYNSCQHFHAGRVVLND